jgi:hypothetical protein
MQIDLLNGREVITLLGGIMAWARNMTPAS